MRFTDSVGTETVQFMHTLGVLWRALYAIWEAAKGATATGRKEKGDGTGTGLLCSIATFHILTTRDPRQCDSRSKSLLNMCTDRVLLRGPSVNENEALHTQWGKLTSPSDQNGMSREELS